MSPPIGAASVHHDHHHPGYAVVVLWSTRGNHKADQRLDADGLASLYHDCARHLRNLEAVDPTVDAEALMRAESL